MKRRLKKKEYVFVASMLFGLVFGAGNLIFPAAMGQRAGAAMLPALMALLYLALTYVGAQSRTVYGIDANGGDSLYHIASHYFGASGGILLGITITCACLKTAIGLVTACSTTFSELFPRSPSYAKYAVFFAFFSFAVSNVGLSHIIAYALPVLYFLYPAAIVLIVLCLLEGVLGYHRPLFVGTMIGTCTAAAFDFIKALSPSVQSALPGIHLLRTIGEALPLSVIGMGWVVPSITGLLLGSIVLVLQKNGPIDAEGPF